MIYYNDISPFSCMVIEKLIGQGFLPEGKVDCRDIRDVKPEDLSDYTQVHLFAGVGGFPLGLRMAGIPDEFPMWTGGDPCQGNSQIGGVYPRDRTNFAVHFLGLIEACRPPIVLRENSSRQRTASVQSWQGFRDCLESLDYAVLPFRMRSCCVGAGFRGERVFLLSQDCQADFNGLQRVYREGVSKGKLRGTHSDRTWGWEKNDMATSRFVRSRNGVPNQVDRITSIGNAVDPRMVATIGRFIANAMEQG